MNLNVTVNEGCQSSTVTAGVFNVRAFYDGQQDAGHVFGPFGSREEAERCLVTLAAREDVESAAIEEVS